MHDNFCVSVDQMLTRIIISSFLIQSISFFNYVFTSDLCVLTHLEILCQDDRLLFKLWLLFFWIKEVLTACVCDSVL